MIRTRIAPPVLALALGLLTACSSGDGQETDTGGAEPSTAPSSSAPSPRSTPTATPATEPPTPTEVPTTPPGPVLAELPEEGRDLASCADGRCRVTVVAGDRVTVPPALFGGTVLVIESIEQDAVTVVQERPDGGGTSLTLFDAASGSGLTDGGDTYTLAFVVIGDGEALMQVDV